MLFQGSAPILRKLAVFSALFSAAVQAQTCSYSGSTPVAIRPGQPELIGEINLSCFPFPSDFDIVINFGTNYPIEVTDPISAVATIGGTSIHGTGLENGVRFSFVNAVGSSLRITGIRIKASPLLEDTAINAFIFATTSNSVFLNANLHVGYVLSKPNIFTPDLPTASTGVAYSKQLSALGGTTPYTWAVSSGSLPPGLSLDPTLGIISGTPNTKGNYTFNITARDGIGAGSNPKAFSLGVSSLPVPSCSLLTIASPLILLNETEPIGELKLSCSSSLPVTGSVVVELTGESTITITRPELATGIAGISIPGTQETSNSLRFLLGGGSGDTLTIRGVLISTKNFTSAQQISATVTLLDHDSVVLYRGPTNVTGVAIPPFDPPFDVNITTPSALPNGTVGVPYSPVTLAVSSAEPLGDFRLVAGTLPHGLTFDTGRIYGTPTARGEFRFAVRAYNRFFNVSPTRLFTILIGDPTLPPVISTSSLPNGGQGYYYNPPLFAATGGVAPYLWSVTSGNPPPGLALRPGGLLDGVPTALGTYFFSVVVKDSVGAQSAPVTYSITIHPSPPPVLVPNPPRNGAIGISYNNSSPIGTIGGSAAPYSWSIISGNLPPGLTLNSEGAIRGTPTATGTYSFVVVVKDGLGVQSLPVTYSLTIQASIPTCTVQSTPIAVKPGISETVGEINLDCSSPLPSDFIFDVMLDSNGVPVHAPDPTAATATVGETSFPGSSRGADANVVRFLFSGTAGNSVRISGVRAKTSPLAEGATIRAMLGFPGPAAIDVNYAAPFGSYPVGYVFSQVTVFTPNLPIGANGVTYQQQLQALGGTAPYTNWTVSTGTLPPGLSLNPTTGAITGTSNRIGTFTFDVTVTDSTGITSSPKTLTIGISSLPVVPTCGVYSSSGHRMNGRGTSESISDLLLTCDPSIPAEGSIIVKLHEATIAPVSSSTAKAIDGMFFGNLLISGDGSFTRGVIEGPDSIRLPLINFNGKHLAIKGILVDVTGQPSHSFLSATVTLKDTAFTDIYRSKIEAGYVFPANQGPNITTNSPLPEGTLGIPYSQDLSLDPASSNPAWLVMGGELPPGVNLNFNTGRISGTPTSSGIFTVAISGIDNTTYYGQSPTKVFTLTIKPGVSISSSILPAAITGANYRATLTASGGQAPYSNWTLTSGSLPPGISIDPSTGTLNGTPTTLGVFTFGVTVRDNSGNISPAKAFTLSVVAPALTFITGPALPGATRNINAAYQLGVVGGNPPYSWTLASGNLPPGLILGSTNGLISGTPTRSGVFTFTVAVRDSQGTTASQSFTMDVAGLRITTPPTLPSGGLGNTYTISLSAAGGSNLFQWEIVSGSLPPGLTLFSNGTITGSPLFFGTTTFSARATEIAPQGNDQRTLLAVTPPESAIQNFTLSIPASVNITTSSLRDATASASYSSKFEARGGTGPLAWTILDRSLPGGVSLSRAGELQGTPATAGTYNFRVSATDGSGASDTESFTLKVINGFTRAGVLSQIASGGGWKTSITLVNPSAFPVNIKVNLLGNDGAPLALPFTGITEPASVIERTIDARGTLLFETASNSSSTATGWADIFSSGEVTGYAIFKQQNHDGIVSEGTVPLERSPTQSFVLPFDNTAGFTTGVALATTSEANSNSVTATIRDEQGASIGNYSLILSGRGHNSFALSDQFGVTTGKRGSVEFRLTSGTGISGIGLRFASNSSFTSIPVAKPVQAGVFSQIASGGPWKTSLSLLNPHSVPVTVKVSFQSQNGAPWTLPLNVSSGFNSISSTSSTIEETLAPHQTLLIETEAPNAVTASGWANVKASSPLTGFAIFRQRGSGQDSEGTTPLENLTQSSIVLPFDNKTGFTTGVALVSPIEGRASTIKATFWDERGVALSPETIALPAQGHTSFQMGSKFSSTQGKSGFVLFEAPTDLSVTGIGLRFSPSGTFTSIPTAQR